MKLKWDAVLTATLVGCMLLTTALVVRREFFAPQARKEATEVPKFVEDWRIHRNQGVQMGPTSAPVQLIEFADFECPYCANFHKVLKTLRDRYPAQVALTYIHFPIPGHRFALPAARVAECAAEQGRFEAMYDQLFGGQDSFGLKPWDDYALAAGVPDLPKFEICVKKTDPILRVEEGKALGAKLDIQATPTLIVNGWKLGHPPSGSELDQMVQRVLAGKSPVDSKS